MDTFKFLRKLYCHVTSFDVIPGDGLANSVTRADVIAEEMDEPRVGVVYWRQFEAESWRLLS